MSYNAIELAELMHTGKYSDMTLVCAEQEFKVHKMVVCSQSPVFAAAIDGPFQVFSSPCHIWTHALKSNTGIGEWGNQHRGI